MNARTPVIVVSIVSDPAVIDECISAGANAYHVKPVRRVELITEVKKRLAARDKRKAY
jgi:DNA-binding NarL/FixJ family response regulator